MTKTGRSNAHKTGLRNLALITGSMSIAVNSAAANERKQRGSAEESQLVAHISFGSQRAVDMAIRKDPNNNTYLYVEHSRDEGISVIDVTQPVKPKVLGLVSWSNPAVTSQMNVRGRLGIITESAAATDRDKTLPDLVVWDLSNPASPRIVHRFSGVVRWFQDERDFVYVLNDEGLFVISELANGQPE